MVSHAVPSKFNLFGQWKHWNYFLCYICQLNKGSRELTNQRFLIYKMFKLLRKWCSICLLLGLAVYVQCIKILLVNMTITNVFKSVFICTFGGH